MSSSHSFVIGAVVVVQLLQMLTSARVFHMDGDHDRDERAMDYSEQSGEIKLCEGESCGAPGRREIKFRLSRLVEIDANGVPVPERYVELESLHFSLRQGLPAPVPDADGNPFTPVTFAVIRNVSLHGADSNAPPTIIVNVTGMITPRPVRLLMYGGASNLTVDLPERALKLYFQIAYWPFQSAQNRLLFVTKIRCRSRKGEDKRPPQVEGVERPPPSTRMMMSERHRPAHEKRFRLGEDDADGQYLDAPSAVVVDGQVVENVVQVVMNPADHEMAYAWVFPSFRNSIVYDPTIVMASVSGGGGMMSAAARGSTAHPVAGVALALLLAFLLI